MGKVLQKLRSVDFYKKIPSDLTEATLTGASLSMVAALLIAFLLVAEFRSYMHMETKSDMIVDRSLHGELLRVNFNISFPALSCEYATLDVSDALGAKKLNLTKTVRKAPIDESTLKKVGFALADVQRPEPKYDDHSIFDDADFDEKDFESSLNEQTWEMHMKHYDVVIVNFFAPWCSWCQQLAPTWEAVTKKIHESYPESDRRIRMAKVDCVAFESLCRKHQITAYPSIRIFIHGTDEVVNSIGQHQHLAYYGDRTTDALFRLAEQAANAHGKPKHAHGIENASHMSSESQGCNFHGQLLVKKVPGTLHFTARAPGHTVDYMKMNMSHHVHQFFFGTKPTPRKQKALAQYHPLGLTQDWADKLKGKAFASPSAGSTYEHYMQVVLTSIEPKKNKHARFDAYEYTVQSHAYDTEDYTSAKFTYKMSPIQIVVTDKEKHFFHFITAVCAVVGGIFTVAGMIDSMVYQVNTLKKKVELGKHS